MTKICIIMQNYNEMMTSCLIPVIVWPAKHLWSTCNNAIHVINCHCWVSQEKRNDWDVNIYQKYFMHIKPSYTACTHFMHH